MPLRSQLHLLSMGRVASNGTSPDFWPGSITSFIAVPGAGFARLIVMPGAQCDRLRLYRVPTGQPLNKATHQIADLWCKPGVEVQYVDGDPNILNVATTEGTPGRQWTKNVSFYDTFDRANAALNASPVAAYGGSWVHDGLIANAAAIDTNALKGNTADSVGSAYKAPSPGTANHFAQLRALVTSTTGVFVCCRLVDRNNFVGVRVTPTTIEVVRRLAGNFSAALFAGSSATPFDVVRLECSGSTWTLKKNGVVVQTGAIPADQPSSNDVGYVARSSATVTVDDLAFGALSTSGKYVHLNTNLENRAMTSLDGINWSAQTVPYDAAIQVWLSVCWSPELGLFCAVASGGGTPSQLRVMTSPDGISWTIRNSGTTATFRGICWGGSVGAKLFVAVSSATSATNVMTSPDGITWTAQTKPNTNQLYGVCWSQELGLFVATCITGTGNRVVTSPDGVNWTARTTPVDNNWQAVCWSKERSLFVAVAVTGTGNRVMTSPDGTNWTIRTSASDHNWCSVCWSAEVGLFVATANSGSPTTSRIMTSLDGINWTTRTHPVGNATQTVLWARELGLFVGVANSGAAGLARVITSPDGITWTARLNSPDGPGWVGLGWSGSKLVAVAQANGINSELLNWSGLGLKVGDVIRYGFNITVSGMSAQSNNPGRTVGSAWASTGQKLNSFNIIADSDAFGFASNTDVASAFDSLVFYKQTAKAAPQGYWDYYALPVAGYGNEGDASTIKSAVGVMVV